MLNARERRSAGTHAQLALSASLACPWPEKGQARLLGLALLGGLVVLAGTEQHLGQTLQINAGCTPAATEL
jgi:hypothetical protein